MPVAPEFERCAPVYDSRARLQRSAARWLAEWLPARCGSPAIELGAGTGFFTREALRTCDELVATDLSPNMTRSGRENLPGARWEVADALHPPRLKQPYETVFSCSLAQWLPDPAAVFRAWHDIAAPGALLLGGWFVGGTMADFFEICPEASPFSWRSAQEWSTLVASAGWKIKRAETRNFELVHTSSAEMLREIHDVGAMVSRRLGTGRLRAALRANDRKIGSADGLRTDFVFMRLEASRS